MVKKGTKATRKFAASGLLTKKIQARRKHQQIQRKVNKIRVREVKVGNALKSIPPMAVKMMM